MSARRLHVSPLTRLPSIRRVRCIAMKTLAHGILLLLVSAAPFAQAWPAIGSDTDDVDRYIRTAMARQRIPGLSLVVIRDGKTIKSSGYGLANVELNVPARPETVYELASATKSLVAAAVVLLAQDGRLDLDEKVRRFVDGAPTTWNNITVRHLLTPTSRIQDLLRDPRRGFPHDASPEQIVRAAIDAPLNFTPGERWSYSNTGYVVLGLIVRKASGRSYDAFLQERVFKP